MIQLYIERIGDIVNKSNLDLVFYFIATTIGCSALTLEQASALLNLIVLIITAISLTIGLILSLIRIISKLYAKCLKAKEDGKVTSEEVLDIVATGQAELTDFQNEVNDSIEIIKKGDNK